jgi:3-methyladenine DNA glycosylase AlkC
MPQPKKVDAARSERRPLQVKDVPLDRLVQLQTGAAETKTLTETLALNLAVTARACIPALSAQALAQLEDAQGLGITRRMALAGQLCLDALGPKGVVELSQHPSDTVRGFACFAIAQQSYHSVHPCLHALRPLADDPHFGVREWAWLALRPRVAVDIEGSIAALQSWTRDPSPRIRRFASEVSRPRGVWCTHIQRLKDDPSLGLPVIEPLRGDDERYVQDSVANWLNDASKTQPLWVQNLIQQWQSDSRVRAAPRILKRAVRSLA